MPTPYESTNGYTKGPCEPLIVALIYGNAKKIPHKISQHERGWRPRQGERA